MLVLRPSDDAALEEGLGRSGAVLLRARSTEEACRLVEGLPVDLAFVELPTPAESAEACAELRARLGPSVPIAVAVPNRTGTAVEDVLAAGADVGVRGPEELDVFLACAGPIAELSSRTRRLEAELERSVKEASDVRGFTDDLVGSLPSRLLVVDEDMRVLFANRTALEGTGLDSVSAIGRGIEECLPEAGERDGALSGMLRGALRSGRPSSVSGVHLAGDPEGATTVVNVRVEPCALSSAIQSCAPFLFSGVAGTSSGGSFQTCTSEL